jgi:hypothetical protein
MNKKLFIRGYIQAALWSSICIDSDDCEFLDEKYDETDLAKETLEHMEKDCIQFIKENDDDLFEYAEKRVLPNDGEYTASDCAGPGFWDRGLKRLGDRLTSATEKFAHVDLYVGDDGKIYQM